MNLTNMQCDLEQLHRYHDGELDASASRDVESHLAKCPSCQAMLEELRGLSSFVAMAAMPAVDAARLNAIAHAAWRSSSERGVRRLAGWITAAAAAVMLFALVDLPSRDASENGSMAQSGAVAQMNYASVEWEQAAITPINANSFIAEGGNRDLVQFAQWMATDLGVGESTRQR